MSLKFLQKIKGSSRALIKKSLALGVALVVVVSATSPAFAAASSSLLEKDETVYFQLTSSGTLAQATVVNALSPQNSLVEDFGTYTSVKNLSNAIDLKQAGDRVYAEVPLDDNQPFYYEGQLKEAASPWAIAIDYQLNQKAISPEALAGKSGHLTLTISVKPSTDLTTPSTSPKDPSKSLAFSDRMTLSLTAALKTEVASQVTAPGATVVTVGGDKQIHMTLLPKQSKTFVIEADVKNFEMDSIAVTAVDAALGLDIDPRAATDGLAALEAGAKDLTRGTKQLKTGADQLSAGTTKVSQAFDKVLLSWSPLLKGIEAFAKGLRQAADQGTALARAADQLNQELTAGQAQVSSAELKQLATQLAGSQDPAVKKLALATLGQMTLIDQAQGGVAQVKAGIDAYTAGVKALDTEYGKLEAGLKALGKGLADLDIATDTLTAGLEQLPGQIGKVLAGQRALEAGIATAQKELDAKLSELPSLSEEDAPALPSFVSDKNTPNSVQFVMRTPAITVPEPQAEAVEKPVQLTPWQRLLRLFGL